MKLFWVGIDRSVSVGDPTSLLKRPGLVTIRSTLIKPSACDLYLRDFERMRGLPYQNARILRRSSFGASRLTYLLIYYPYYEHSELVQRSGLQRAVLSQWSTAYSTNSSGCRQLSQLDTVVLVSAGSCLWLLLPIWPQPHRPSDLYSQL